MAVCISYFVLLGVFAQIYYYLYSTDHTRFVFAAEILTTRRQEIAASREMEKARIQRLLGAVNQLSAYLDDKHAVIHVSRVDKSFVDIQTRDFSYQFSFDAAWSGTMNGKVLRAAGLMVFEKGKAMIGQERVFIIGPDLSLEKTIPRREWDAIMESYYPPKTPGKFQEMITALKVSLAHRIGEFDAVGERFRDSKAAEWTFPDFLYFSTITQTTVGYGDILPNRSIVRLLVSVQVLVGLVLIAVAINLVTATE